MKAYDHFIYGGRELDAMRADFTALTGVEPTLGGRHPGLGTHNALASLGDTVYFELLAVDPQQTPDGNMGARLQQFTVPRLFAYMLKATGGEMEAAKTVLADHGIEADLFDASRTTPDGRVLRWRLLVPHDNAFGDFVPKLIDWQNTPHPAANNARGCRFESFEMGHPRAAELNALLKELDAPHEVLRADRAYMQLRIGSPRGRTVLTSRE